MGLGRVITAAVFGGPEAAADFERSLPPEGLAEWRALASEQDPKILFADLIALAQRLQERHPETAARLYAATAKFLHDMKGPLREAGIKAESHLQALNGGGSFGPRAEFLLSRLTQDATDPSSLFAMGLATHAFRWGRVCAALRLGRSGPATRALANGAGFLLETSAFTLGHKSVSAALGHRQDWSPAALGREWAAGALFLGPLKVMGETVRYALGRYMGPPGLAALAQEAGVHGLIVKTLPQAGMFAGVLIGQDLQRLVGLRAAQDVPARFADALSTLFQLNTGNSLFAAALGRKWQRGQAEAELVYHHWRSQDSGAAPRDKIDVVFDAYDRAEVPFFHYSPSAPGRRKAAPLPHEAPSALMMAGENPGGPKHRWTTEDFARLGEFRASLTLVEAEALSTIHPDQRHMMLFSRLLQRMEFPDRETKTLAFCKLGHVMKHANDAGNAGGYVNWLTRKVFNSYLESQDLPRATALLQFLMDGGRLLDYEKLLAASVPPARYAFVPPWVTTGRRAHYPHYERIQQLRLPEAAKRVLFRWVYTQTNAKAPEPHFLPEDLFLDRIGEALFFPGYGELVGNALTASERSPFPFYRLQRIHGLLGKIDALTPSKLMEIADPEFLVVGRKTTKLPVPLFRKSRPAQFNGYLGERAPLDLLEELQHRQAELLDPKQAEARKLARTRVLEGLDAVRSRLSPENRAYWAYAFELLGDPFSKRIAADLKAGKFDLQVLEKDDFARRCRELGEEDAVGENAFYLHSGVTGGKPLMMVRAIPYDSYSQETRPDPVFVVLAKIAHEYQHHLDIDPAEPRTLPVVHLQEMRAHLREALWRAHYGDVWKLASFVRDGNGGLALHWRDKFESLYGHHFKRD